MAQVNLQGSVVCYDSTSRYPITSKYSHLRLCQWVLFGQLSVSEIATLEEPEVKSSHVKNLAKHHELLLS